MIGVLAAAILIVNVNLPNVIEMLCSVAIVWANLAYLMVTIPLLLSRRSPREPAVECRRWHRAFFPEMAPPVPGHRAYFSLGRWGLPVNAGRRRLGALRRHQYQLAAVRDLRRPSAGAASRRRLQPSR